MWETEIARGREKYNGVDIADDFAYIATAANVDESIFDIDSVAFVVADDADVVDDALEGQLDVGSASGAAPPKAHEKTQPPTKPVSFWQQISTNAFSI